MLFIKIKYFYFTCQGMIRSSWACNWDWNDKPREYARLPCSLLSTSSHTRLAVHWKHSFATTGRFDVVDLVESDDLAQVEKAVMIIRAYGHSTTETLVATPWKEFLDSL